MSVINGHKGQGYLTIKITKVKFVSELNVKPLDFYQEAGSEPLTERQSCSTYYFALIYDYIITLLSDIVTIY